MRVLSGIQPTGTIHIGNYLGAIRQFLELQKKAECIFPIVDLHAITVPYPPTELKKNIIDAVTTYLALGINPKKSIIFVQSQIKEHAELCWLLNTITPVGGLQRMTQFKEKAREHKKDVNIGLLDYPVLMAADILLYKADSIPVGKDQMQHIELTRTIARKFNQRFGKTFDLPKGIMPKMGAKIMSLADPSKKMAKSLGPQHYLALSDTPAMLRQKIMSAVTDPGKEIKYNLARKPGISNLLTIYSLFSGKPIKELEKEFAGKGYAEFKKSLVAILIKSLGPFQKKKKELQKRESYIQEILEKGAKKAQTIASSTIQEVKQKMGLL